MSPRGVKLSPTIGLASMTRAGRVGGKGESVIEPPEPDLDWLTLDTLVNKYLTSKLRKVETGGLSKRSSARGSSRKGVRGDFFAGNHQALRVGHEKR
jgi:hypothetical protein